MKTDYTQHVGEEARPTIIGAEIRALGQKATEVACSEFNRGYHHGYDAAIEDREDMIKYAAKVWFCIGLLTAASVTCLIFIIKA
jgi:hypothetical protein